MLTVSLELKLGTWMNNLTDMIKHFNVFYLMKVFEHNKQDINDNIVQLIITILKIS